MAIREKCGDMVWKGIYLLLYIENSRRRNRRQQKCRRLFLSVPCGARFQRVKVPDPPGSGKDIAEGRELAWQAAMSRRGSWYRRFHETR